MGLDAGIISSGIEGIANFGATLLNNRNQLKMQDREMDFARESYNTQRADALSDREHEERYNSSIAQQQRLRDAGLNPIEYMSDPVSSDTRDSGSIAQPASRELKSPLADLGHSIATGFDRWRQLRNDEHNNANTDANTALTDSQRRSIEVGTSIAQNEEARNKTRFDMEKQDFANRQTMFKLDLKAVDEQIKGMKMDNELKNQAFDHNAKMYPLIEELQGFELRLKKDTRDLVIKKMKSDIELQDAQVKNLGQIYVMRGPEAFIAETYTQLFGDLEAQDSSIYRQLMTQFECSELEAQMLACDLALKMKGQQTDGYKRGVVNSVSTAGLFRGKGVSDKNGPWSINGISGLIKSGVSMLE